MTKKTNQTYKTLKTSLNDLKRHIDQGEIADAVRLLESVASERPLELATLIRQNQLLSRCKSAPQRRILKESYLHMLLSLPISGELMRAEVAHAFYAELISAERDTIAAAARTAADTIAPLGFALGAELCCGAVAALAQKHLASSAATRTPRGAHQRLNEFLADLSYEVGGIHQLLPIMLRELAVSCAATSTTPSTPPVSLLTAAREARNLLGLAEDWQSSIGLRQRIAFGFTKVLKVEAGPKVIVAPADAESACLNLISRQRISLHGLHPRPVKGIEELFGHSTKALSEVSINLTKADPSKTTPTHLASALTKYIASHIRHIDGILLETLPQGDENNRLRCLWIGYLFTVSIGLASGLMRKGFSRKRHDYYIWCSINDIIKLVATLAGAPETSAREAISLLTTNAATQQPLDLSTHPLLHMDSQYVGINTMPTLPDAFMETRRILAAGNHTSRLLGKAYEEHIRNIIRDAGVTTLTSSVKLNENGRTLTDVDILGIKDGIVFVAQAKYMAEPGDHHERWKGLEHIGDGVRQCLIARAYFARHPKRLSELFPGTPIPKNAELCCFVVSPSFHFSHTGTWPVFVIDDQYLDHIVRVKHVSTYEFTTGDARESRRLFEGEHPTGQELRNLIINPAFQESLQTGTNALIETESKVGRITISEFVAAPVFSEEEPQPGK